LAEEVSSQVRGAGCVRRNALPASSWEAMSDSNFGRPVRYRVRKPSPDRLAAAQALIRSASSKIMLGPTPSVPYSYTGILGSPDEAMHGAAVQSRCHRKPEQFPAPQRTCSRRAPQRSGNSTTRLWRGSILARWLSASSRAGTSTSFRRDIRRVLEGELADTAPAFSRRPWRRA